VPGSRSAGLPPPHGGSARRRPVPPDSGNPWRVGHPDREISTIAHELQHALEIAEAAEVIDTASLTRHFRRIGYVSADSARLVAYETAAARRTGDQVLGELQRAGRHTEVSSFNR
jgi:hypothetical protein